MIANVLREIDRDRSVCCNIDVLADLDVAQLVSSCSRQLVDDASCGSARLVDGFRSSARTWTDQLPRILGGHEALVCLVRDCHLTLSAGITSTDTISVQ